MTKKSSVSPSAKRSGKSSARTKARKFALQALYQMQMTQESAFDVESQFVQEHNIARADTEYFHEIMIGVEQQCEELDNRLSVYLDRTIKELDPIERAILRMGAWELIFRLDIPFRVIINEHIELARSFGATESHRYVNSILDKLAREMRTVETASNKP